MQDPVTETTQSTTDDEAVPTDGITVIEQEVPTTEAEQTDGDVETDDPMFGEVTPTTSSAGDKDPEIDAAIQNLEHAMSQSTMVVTKGRNVIVRNTTIPPSNGSHEHPAIITRVNANDTINVMLMPDNGMPHPVLQLPKIDPTSEAKVGWFWPWEQ